MVRAPQSMANITKMRSWVESEVVGFFVNLHKRIILGYVRVKQYLKGLEPLQGIEIGKRLM